MVKSSFKNPIEKNNLVQIGLFIGLIGSHSAVQAAGITSVIQNVNSDTLSHFIKPIAFETKYGVIEIDTSVELGYRSDNNGTAKFDKNELISQLGFHTQLDNGTDLSAVYQASYANERNDAYEDDLQIGFKDQWGEIQIGDISNLIFQRTHRSSDTDFANVRNDRETLPIKEGVFYQWRTPATQWMAAIDYDANLQFGARYYKPVKGVEYTLAGRTSLIDNDDGDAQGVGEAQTFAVVGQAQRGRWVIDSQYLRERLALLTSNQKQTLQALSAGIHYKADRWKLSLNGLERENELNDTERRISFDTSYDVSRGMSVNLDSSVFNSKQLPEKFYSHGVSLEYKF